MPSLSFHHTRIRRGQCKIIEIFDVCKLTKSKCDHRFSIKTLYLLAAIAAASNAVILHCPFDIDQWPIIATSYGCQATVTDTQNATHLVEVTGQHIPRFTDDDVEFIAVFFDTNMKTIPKGIGAHFPNLLLFSWGIGSLQSVSSDDLEQFPNLWVLSLSSNHLLSLDGNLLQHNPRLQSLSLQFNDIGSIGHNLIADLNDLRQINLRGNRCIDLSAQTRADVIEMIEILRVQCPSILRR